MNTVKNGKGDAPRGTAKEQAERSIKIGKLKGFSWSTPMKEQGKASVVDYLEETQTAW